MEKIKITHGVFWVEISEANLYILCGCPADSVKHLMRMGLIVSREKDGVSYETGPNAILLSDVPVQNGSFANLAEFPLLQMFYRQGKLIPGHPNNDGEKPYLIGIPGQVQAQSEYFYRGNYGLIKEEELKATGISDKMVKDILRLKLKYAFGKIKKTEELLTFKIIEKVPIEVKGVRITRKGLNIYEFEYKDKTLTVDMNLRPHEEYEPPVRLDYHKIYLEYFSVIHIGEGNGWDTQNPCMSSLLVFQGKIYLIDTGPNITNSLTALGISINEIEGVFHTHAHDDHFAGLTTLVRSDHMIKYYATPLVRHSVMKKLSALMRIPERQFDNYFEFHDLEFNKWNNLEGLEVMPVFSPHPVETNIFFFRTFWRNGYRSYAHFADIIALDALNKMVTDDPDAPGVSSAQYKRIQDVYLHPVTIKKIDAGGGMIHGSAKDFSKDKSGKIILAHIAGELSANDKEIGSNATFGAQDVLIESLQDYSIQSAYRFLRSYFPKAPICDINMLLNCPTEKYNVGHNIVRKGVTNDTIYLLLHGVVELIDSSRDIYNILSAGSMLGEYSGMTEAPSRLTYRCKSYVKVLTIPCELYVRFINRNYNFRNIIKFHKNIWFLQSTWLFGELISSKILNKIALQMDTITLEAGAEVSPEDPQLYLIKKGRVELYFEDIKISSLGRGDFWGEDSVLLRASVMFKARIMEETKIHLIPGTILKHIPIIEWKLLESYEKRIQAFGTHILEE